MLYNEYVTGEVDYTEERDDPTWECHALYDEFEDLDEEQRPAPQALSPYPATTYEQLNFYWIFLLTMPIQYVY